MKRLLLISILIGLLDQVVKKWSALVVPLGGKDIELLLIPWGEGERVPLITITHVHNNGIAFGMMQDVPQAAQFFTISSVVMSLVIVGAIAMLYKKEPGICFALSLQLGGAIGNVIDRFRDGYVLDFIQLPNWPVFNVADISVTVGTVLLIYYLIKPRSLGERRVSAPVMEDGVIDQVGFTLPENSRLDEAAAPGGNSGGMRTAHSSNPGKQEPDPGQPE